MQTAAGLAALDGTGIDSAGLGLFKMEQSDDCVYDLSGNCLDDGTLESLPSPSEVSAAGGGGIPVGSLGGGLGGPSAPGGLLDSFLGPNLFSIILYKLFKNLQDFFSMPFNSIGNGPLASAIGP